MEDAIDAFINNRGPKPDGLEVHQLADRLWGKQMGMLEMKEDIVGDACKLYRQNACAQKAKSTCQWEANANQCQVIPMAMGADEVMRSYEPCALAKEFLRKCPKHTNS